ncbi:MAG: hypothetical protein MHM6MM_003078 [Cercozoa sp. M6MM]
MVSVLHSVWGLLSSLMVLYDVAFIFLRPRSLPGGDLAEYFPAHPVYVKIDPEYGDASALAPVIMQVMCIVEIALFCVAALRRKSSPRASALTFLVVNTMVLWKTVSYMANVTLEISQDGLPVSQQEFLQMFLLPNAMWIIIPLLAIRDLCSVLMRPPTSATKRKTQ